MTEQKAKQIINAVGYPNVMQTLEAFEVAYAALGRDANLTEIFKWAQNNDVARIQNEKFRDN